MKQFVLILLCFASVFAGSAQAQDALAQEAPTPRRPRLGLALTLGGMAGSGTSMALNVATVLLRETRCEGAPCGTRPDLSLAATGWVTPAATALAVWAAGRAAGGGGNYGITLLGSALGGTAGVGLTILGALANEDRAFSVGLFAVPLLEWIGAAIAYKLSHDANRQRSERRMIPSVQVENGGASLMLSGAL